MKRWFFVALMCAGVAMAQVPARQPVEVRHTNTHTLSFESHRGEAFTVYVDGEMKNRMPQGRVLVTGVGEQSHEVVVVLKRPVDKAAVLHITPKDNQVIINVNYDERLEQLYLYTPSHNRTPEAGADERALRAVVPGEKLRLRVDTVAAKDTAALAVQDSASVVSEADVAVLVQRLKGQAFDSDRLALAKVLVASYRLEAWQIGRLAEAIDISNSQVDFLKYAYLYCSDKGNYYDAVGVLTFSRDRRKVIDYIATLR